MSTFIFFFPYILFVFFFFVGPEAQDICSLHFDKYSSYIYIYIYFVSHWDILLLFLNFIARIEDQSPQARQIESLMARVLFCSGWPGS